MKKSILVLAAVIVAVAGGSAEAAHLITSSQIKDGTIRGKDIHNGTISLSKFTHSVQRAIKNGTKQRVASGPAGANGANGSNGVNGRDGAPGKDATTRVSSLSGDFAASNSSVTITPGGALFGPYADASHGASITYDGLDGVKLEDVAQLAYTAGYSESTDTHCDAPYLRVFLNGDSHDAIFSPNTQGSGAPTEQSGKTVHYDVTKGVLRYDDDAGAGGQYGLSGAPWDTVVNDHGSEVVSGVRITTGFACNNTPLEGWLNSLSVEAKGQQPRLFSFGG